MMKNATHVILFSLLWLVVGCSYRDNSEFSQFYEVRTEKSYDDVLAELKIAITENNFRITAHSRIGKVIRQREKIDFPEYDTVSFCNLTHAKKLLLLEPDAVSHMPCTIVLYAQDGAVTVKTRLLPMHTSNQELNKFS
ncbi:MAG: DUF302 domain-containing protein, partial [Methylococcales bacterium]